MGTQVDYAGPQERIPKFPSCPQDGWVSGMVDSAGNDKRPAGVPCGGLGFLIRSTQGASRCVYPALSIILALLILYDPMTLKQGIGIVLALRAMFLIAT